MRQATVERERLGGPHKIYRFDNGYGASVVKHQFSYGGDEGKWELAVIKYHGKGEGDWSLTYDTEITDDVLGYLGEGEVDELLSRIEALPAPPIDSDECMTA